MDWQTYVLPQEYRFSPTARILDVGCGAGRHVEHAPGAFKLGVEPSPELARECLDRGIAVVRGFAEYLPLQDGSFDGVICKVVLCLTEEDLAIKEMARVLRQDGTCYLAVNGSGYYLRYLLLGNWKERFYGLRTLINSWYWAVARRMIPGFMGDTIYQSSRRLRRYLHTNELTLLSERSTRFLGFPVFIWMEAVKLKTTEDRSALTAEFQRLKWQLYFDRERKELSLIERSVIKERMEDIKRRLGVV